MTTTRTTEWVLFNTGTKANIADPTTNEFYDDGIGYAVIVDIQKGTYRIVSGWGLRAEVGTHVSCTADQTGRRLGGWQGFEVVAARHPGGEYHDVAHNTFVRRSLPLSVLK